MKLTSKALLVILSISAFAARSFANAQTPTGLDLNGHLQAVDLPQSKDFAFTQLESGVQVHVHGVTKNIIFYGPTTIRVNANLGENYWKFPSIVVTGKPAVVPFQVQDSSDALNLVSEKLHLSVDKMTGAVTFMDASGKEITKEKGDNPSEIKQLTISNAPTYEVKQTFTLAPDESIYGLGQYEQRPYMDYRGQQVLLVQTNIGITVPLLISTKRYGILWDIYSKGTFIDDANGATFWGESAPGGVDYYFIAGQDMDGVISGYRDLTGAAPMYPKAAFGLFMSKERYTTQDRLIEVVKNFRDADFPLDYIVQDWQYWGTDHDGFWSGMVWNKERYPDPAALTKTLHDDLHVKLMISIWPSVGNDTELAHELDIKNLRFAPLHWISKQARVYDAYSPEGRAIYFKYIKSGLLDVGVDALWMDGTEVEVGGACHDPGGVEHDIKGLGDSAMGDFTRYLNTYSLLTTKGAYEGQRASSDKRVVTLTRSAWTGQQRYAALPWSGDTTASWQTLHDQISGGLNVAMAGLPYWTQDTGGFFVNFANGEKNPEYQELYARWNQFAIFNPIYRIHGTSIEREPYVFKTLAPDLYKSLLDAAHLRYELLPYNYSLGWMTTNQGYTPMRGLVMDFPDDQKVRRTDDVFMFGPAFLVHAISRAMYHTSDPAPETIPTEVLQTPDGARGLAVQYFDGENFEKTAGTTIDAKVDHTWPGPPLANPPPGLTDFNHFSGRWEGTITAPEDGEYEIGVEVDDGARLFLDGKLVIDDWNYAAKRYKGAKITLTKDQKVAVKLEYFQGQFDRVLRLCWRTPEAVHELAKYKASLNNIAETYLPVGADWYDFWTNERFAGGATASKASPLDIIPVYIRAGSIVPFGPDVHYATEQPDAPYEIRVYPGANAKFTIYEDDNETYNYEKGQHATYDLSWNDATRTLLIGARKGSFPGMTSSRDLNIVLAIPGKNAGLSDAGNRTNVKTVHYTGAPLEVKFAE